MEDDGLPEDNEWKLDPEDLEKLEQIGGGNFGAVFRVPSSHQLGFPPPPILGPDEVRAGWQRLTTPPPPPLLNGACRAPLPLRPPPQG
jgi:hypothetical protein